MSGWKVCAVTATVLVTLAATFAVLYWIEGKALESCQESVTELESRSEELSSQVKAQADGEEERCQARLDLQNQHHSIELSSAKARIKACVKASETARELDGDDEALLDFYRKLLEHR